ncbi:hypothetical protein JAAARDRAFT_151484 [Jaapia argillacea MUCL 33604]|uniref:Probable guanine deaminase n=1 Tax=Jaapia argillacea MUCL 33604 TaxID=933084 RepID=A0A067Q1B4_9AGAM|nr:hypothetical protein JAAARDRAFT_151484 [Jaapia argillacea MUCL 33604]
MASNTASVTVFHGAVINPVNLSLYDALPSALLCVASSGEILWIEQNVPDSMVQDVMARNGHILDDTVNFVQLKRGEFLMPGFIDTHTHAPQVPNIGSGGEHELLDWLAEVTFPMEARFSDVEFSRKTYRAVVRRIIDSGTTTCCYYGTIHLEGTKALADVVHEFGQRAFVGKCNMDRNSSEDYVEPSPTASIDATRDLITYIRTLPLLPASPSGARTNGGTRDPDPRALVHPIITPRFAITCTAPLLSGLGKLAAADPTLHIQTHISENKSEVVFTKSLFPECTGYADVYDKAGLLRDNTILAHAVHLTDDEMDVIKKRGAGISHCPTSNFNLRSGVSRVGEMLDRGIKVGLGTDVSGGFSPSVLTAIQHASIASKIVAMQSDSEPPLSPSKPRPSWHSIPFAKKQLPIPTLLHLATLGGAQVCNMASYTGSFAPGKFFDALLVNVREEAGNPSVWGVDVDEVLGVGRGKGEEEELKGMLEKFLFCGDDRNIARVYVHGKVIGGKEWKA